MAERAQAGFGAAPLAAPFATGAAALIAWWAVVGLDLARVPILPCPMFALTGIACPLCGGTRAADALAHGDVAAAAGYNVLFIPAVLVGAALWVRWIVRRVRGSGDRWPTLSPRASAVASGALVLFAVLRNLPGAEWLMP